MPKRLCLITNVKVFMTCIVITYYYYYYYRRTQGRVRVQWDYIDPKFQIG